jgi:hypothetical protein
VFQNDVFHFFGKTASKGKWNDWAYHNACIDKVIDHYKVFFEDKGGLGNVITWSDNCPTQYACRQFLGNLAILSHKHNITFLHMLAEKFGFKGVHDGAGKEVSSYVRKRTSKEEFAPDANFVYELFKDVEPKKKELYERLEEAATQALKADNNGRYNEAMRELYSKKRSYGVNRIFKGLVSADKDDDKFQEIKVNAETANSPENFLIEMNRESNNQLYTEIPQLKTYDCWKAVAGTNKLKYRKLPCWCLSCRNEFYGHPASEFCQYKHITGEWHEIAIFVKNDNVNLSVSLVGSVGEIKDKQLVAVDVNQEELMDIAVIFPSMTLTNKSGNVSSVTKGSVVIYPKSSSTIRFGCGILWETKNGVKIVEYKQDLNSGSANSISFLCPIDSLSGGDVNAESCVDVDVLNVRYCTTTGAEYFSKPKPNKEQILLPSQLILPSSTSDCFLQPTTDCIEIDPPPPTSAVIDPPPLTPIDIDNTPPTDFPIDIDDTPPTDFPVGRGTARPASTAVLNVRIAKMPRTTNDDTAIPLPDDHVN